MRSPFPGRAHYRGEPSIHDTGSLHFRAFPNIPDTSNRELITRFGGGKDGSFVAQPKRKSQPGEQVEFELENQAGFLLRRAYQRAMSIFQEVVGEGLTAPQFAALVKIRDFGVVSQNRLGRSVAMDPATCQGVIQRLFAKKLVSRAADPEDRRRAMLSLTPEGDELLKRIMPAGLEVSEQFLKPLNKAERDTLLALLRKLG